MNIMNFMKHFRGVRALPEKNNIFFSGSVLWGHFDVHLCSLSSLIQLCEVKMALFIIYLFFFMNIMKVYEEGVFMAIFLNCLSICTALVKFYEARNFIKLHRGGSYAQ